MTTPNPRETQQFGWRPDLPDQRDFLYSAPISVMTKLPTGIDLRDKAPKEIYDQSRLGSCVSNAAAAAFEFDLLRQGLADFMPSRLFIYYNQRAIEGTIEYDSGSTIRDAVKVLARFGVCDEEEVPYDIERFTERPPSSAYHSAINNKILVYRRVPRTLSQLKGCLASGQPFIFGFTVYESFESQEVARTGIVSMPTQQETILGGHAVAAVGYDDESARFVVRNSWGRDWGQGGYFTIPYAYLTDSSLSSDFWTLTTVE